MWVLQNGSSTPKHRHVSINANTKQQRLTEEGTQAHNNAYQCNGETQHLLRNRKRLERKWLCHPLHQMPRPFHFCPPDSCTTHSRKERTARRWPKLQLKLLGKEVVSAGPTCTTRGTRQAYHVYACNIYTCGYMYIFICMYYMQIYIYIYTCIDSCIFECITVTSQLNTSHNCPHP